MYKDSKGSLLCYLPTAIPPAGVSLSFSQSEYTVSESDSTFLVQLTKNKPLANPLEVGVTALTLEEANFLGCTCIPSSTFNRLKHKQAGIV
jgi:hypothetical protein